MRHKPKTALKREQSVKVAHIAATTSPNITCPQKVNPCMRLIIHYSAFKELIFSPYIEIVLLFSHVGPLRALCSGRNKIPLRLGSRGVRVVAFSL